MSSISGLGGKGEKNKGKFKAIDINTLYKGKSVETQKSTGKLFCFTLCLFLFVSISNVTQKFCLVEEKGGKASFCY
jgi:hypothetical protein